MDSFTPYPKVWQLTHPGVRTILDGPFVYIQEKVDGSQLSFGIDNQGKLHCRSRGQVFDVYAPDGMFAEAAATILKLAPMLKPGFTYRGEYLRKNKHNVLCYDRVPKNYIILFDVSSGYEEMGREDLALEASRIDLEHLAPILLKVGEDKDELYAIIEQQMKAPSILGGPREGIVIKNYEMFGRDGKILMAKVVSAEFKEVHTGTWKETNPKQGDVLEMVKAKYCTPARWMKAYQHMLERGEITGEMKDIGGLVKETRSDFAAECEAEIKEDLWNWCKSKILDSSTRGLAEWYKAKLMEEMKNGK